MPTLSLLVAGIVRVHKCYGVKASMVSRTTFVLQKRERELFINRYCSKREPVVSDIRSCVFRLCVCVH